MARTLSLGSMSVLRMKDWLFPESYGGERMAAGMHRRSRSRVECQSGRRVTSDYRELWIWMDKSVSPGDRFGEASKRRYSREGCFHRYVVTNRILNMGQSALL